MEITKQDVKSKDVHIKKMEETIHGLDLKIKERDLKTKNLQDKVFVYEIVSEFCLLKILFYKPGLKTERFVINTWFDIEG